jgi:hypothetical protein
MQEQELQEMAHYRTFHGHENQTQSQEDGSVDGNLETNTSTPYYCLTVLICLTETLTFVFTLNIIDLCVTYGYVQPTKMFYFTKSLIWATLMLALYVRYI